MSERVNKQSGSCTLSKDYSHWRSGTPKCPLKTNLDVLIAIIKKGVKELVLELQVYKANKTYGCF